MKRKLYEDNWFEKDYYLDEQVVKPTFFGHVWWVLCIILCLPIIAVLLPLVLLGISANYMFVKTTRRR